MGCSELPPHLLTENLQPRRSWHLRGHARTQAGAQRSALLTPSGCSVSSAPEPLTTPPRRPARGSPQSSGQSPGCPRCAEPSEKKSVSG